MSVQIQDIERRLWDSADERANSGLKESEYSIPVLGLIFLKYADSRFADAEAALVSSSRSMTGGHVQVASTSDDQRRRLKIEVSGVSTHPIRAMLV